jgi:hypothetical protein
MRKRTVVVTMRHGAPIEVEARSFGEAASLINCAHGQIVRFDWKHPEPWTPPTHKLRIIEGRTYGVK